MLKIGICQNKWLVHFSHCQKKSMKFNLIKMVSAMSCAAFLAGCATQQQQQKYVAPAPDKNGYVAAYFPSGKVEGSGLLVEKTAPAEVLAGQPFEYTYKVSNLTDATLENVTLMDRVSSNFTPTDSDPKANSTADGIATWSLGTFGAKEVKTITVKGDSADVGVVTTCGWATYNPVACLDIHVVKASIAVTQTEPSDESICDPIPVTLTVQNTGSSALTGVQIADNLPAGMASSDGKTSLTFDIGSLAPGESRDVKYVATASNTGKLVATAKVTSAEGVTADASATTTVHQPVLTITCKAPDQQFLGRKFDVCYTVSNTGDAPATGSTLAITVPAGLAVAGAGNGQVADGSIIYNLGTIDAGASQNVCATFTAATFGSYQFTGTTKGTCAAATSSSCGTKVVGVAAILLEKSDDPDPVAIGDSTTYTCKITNQGSADDSNVQVVVVIAPELVPVSSSDGTIAGQTVTFPVVPILASKQAVTYTIVAKGVKAGDGHTLFKLNSEMLASPISAEESTHVY
jgi:uncharacterized repeat protein (TIGR01451 family)